MIKYGEETANKMRAENNRKKTLPGEKNPMYGKPAPVGSGNGWCGWFKGIYFRSLRELSLLYYLDKKSVLFHTIENKKYAIKYIDEKGDTRNYFPDYLIINKIIVEVKPRKLICTKENQLNF